MAEGRINTDHELDKAKVVHSYDIEDLDSKVAYCRCWKSKKVHFWVVLKKKIFLVSSC